MGAYGCISAVENKYSWLEETFKKSTHPYPSFFAFSEIVNVYLLKKIFYGGHIQTFNLKWQG